MSKFTTSQRKSNIGAISLNFAVIRWLLLGLMVMGLALYIWQINSLSTFGYQVRDLQKKQSALKQQNDDLNNQVADMRSLAQIQTKIDELSLVPVSKVEYVTPITPIIAQK